MSQVGVVHTLHPFVTYFFLSFHLSRFSFYFYKLSLIYIYTKIPHTVDLYRYTVERSLFLLIDRENDGRFP